MAANPCWHRRGKEGFLHMSPAACEGLCPLGTKCLLALQSWLWCSSLAGGVGSHLTTPTKACPQHGESLSAGAAQNSPLPRKRGEKMDREGWVTSERFPSTPRALCPIFAYVFVQLVLAHRYQMTQIYGEWCPFTYTTIAPHSQDVNTCTNIPQPSSSPVVQLVHVTWFQLLRNGRGGETSCQWVYWILETFCL